MKAIVTGASSGIGKEIALALSDKGYYVILVARREEKLKELLPQLKHGGEIFVCDLRSKDNCIALYEAYQKQAIDILVNNAGFGVFGSFAETDLDRDLSMLHLNILSLHTLTKLFLKNMLQQQHGYILNVASVAGLMSGPLMAAYYASKSYVIRLSRAISKEIKHSNVHISVLCPGPVNTEFNQVAGVQFAVKPLSAKKVAQYTVKQMFKKRFLILPGIAAKISAIGASFLPDTLLSEISFRIQKKKR